MDLLFPSIVCSVQFFYFNLFQSISFCLYLCRAWVPSWQMSSYNNSSGCKKQQHIAHKKIRSQSRWFWAFQTTCNWGRNYTHTYYHSCERHSGLPWSRVRIMSKFFIKMVCFNFIKQTIFFNDKNNKFHVCRYQESGMLTNKSDVYSFGIVLMEILMGQTQLHIAHQVHLKMVDFVELFSFYSCSNEKKLFIT